MNNNKKQKLREDNIQFYEELIEEFDEWYDRDFLKNYRNTRQITIPVDNKNDLFSYILDLAKRIHGLGKHYMLPDYKDDNKLEILKQKLLILKELYKSVFIRSETPINVNKELFAKNYQNKNRNLNQKYINLSKSELQIV